MNPREENPEDPTATEAVPAKYVAFLEHWRAESVAPLEAQPRSEPLLPGWRPEAAASHGEESRGPVPSPPESLLHDAASIPAIQLPRRREAVESLRVRLAPEQLYWLQLAAARAGDKVDASLLVAAGLALLERLPIDWRAVRSRRDLEDALEHARSSDRLPHRRRGPPQPNGRATPVNDR